MALNPYDLNLLTNTFTGSNLPTYKNGPLFNNTNNSVNTFDSSGFINALTTALKSSGLISEQSAVAAANAHAAREAEKNRLFQQASAREAMAFEENQARINREFQQASAREAMAFNEQQNKIAMNYNERMSNTVYQRAIKDLEAAGLNPILAYSNLSTSSPSITAASGYAASGSAASGRSASGATAQSYKADYSKAKSVDLSIIKDFASAAGSLFRAFSKFF